jgi:histidyl-tRNA synthetase
MEMLDWFLKELSITNTKLLINSVGDASCRPAYLEKLRTAIKENLDKLCRDCHHRYETNALRVFDCKVESCQAVVATFPTITDHLDEASREHFAQFRAHLEARGIAYTVNPRMVRGLDYYTRTAFEITGGSLGAQNTLVGGGRYDGLAETLDGPPTKGFGFAFGLDRMVMSLPESEIENARRNSLPDVFVVHLGSAARDHAFSIARQLRVSGLLVGMEFEERKMKKALTQASKSQARYALLIGDDEVATGKYALKNLATGEQQLLNLDEITARLAERNI